MSKKRTKNRQNENARKKVETAQRRNEYIKKLKAVCDMVHPDLYGALLPIQIEAVYYLRGAATKVISDGVVAKEVIEFANEYSRIVEKNTFIKIDSKGDAAISLGDYNHILSPLEWLMRPEPDGPSDPELRPDPDAWERFPWYYDFLKECDRRFYEYLQRMKELQLPIALFMSDLRYTVYCAKYTGSGSSELKQKINAKRIVHYIEIYPYKPERKRIILPNGEIRTAVRLAIIAPLLNESPEYIPIELPPSGFGKDYPGAQKPLPVYITTHALNRMEERLGCGSQGYIQFEIFQCLLDCRKKPKKIRVSHEKLFVEYRLYGYKVGYLVISITKNVILVHTFLLITNNSTPEGALLHKQLSLGKLDKEYLGIDRLATFVNSDIFQYEDTCNLFIHAGCESLIKLSRKLENDILWMYEGETIKLASRMRDYLKTDVDSYADISDDAELEAEASPADHIHSGEYETDNYEDDPEDDAEEAPIPETGL